LQFQETWLLDPVVTLVPTTVTHPAYKRGLTNSLTAFTSPDDATVEFTSAEYTAIGAEDASYVITTGSSTRFGRYANVAQLFTFNTSGYSNITDITCIWKGYRSGSAPDVEKLQVYKATAWENWLTSLPTSNTKYSKSLGNGALYFYSSTWIRFGIYMYLWGDGASYSITLNSDYAALQITYGIVVVAPKAGLSPALIATILEEA